MDKEDKQKDIKTIEMDRFNWILPICCKEGWDSCKHVPQKQKKTKTNIAL